MDTKSSVYSPDSCLDFDAVLMLVTEDADFNNFRLGVTVAEEKSSE